MLLSLLQGTASLVLASDWGPESINLELGDERKPTSRSR
jgi:hypothetical protein